MERGELGLGPVEVPYIVLRRVLGALGIEHPQHALLEGLRIGAFPEHIVQVEDVAQEVAVGESRHDVAGEFGRDRPDPVVVVAPERHVESHEAPVRGWFMAP